MGWIFTQSGAAERDYIMDSQEVQQMAAVQAELGEDAVTGVVSVDNSSGEAEIHFEVPSLRCQLVVRFTTLQDILYMGMSSDQSMHNAAIHTSIRVYAK